MSIRIKLAYRCTVSATAAGAPGEIIEVDDVIQLAGLLAGGHTPTLCAEQSIRARCLSSDENVEGIYISKSCSTRRLSAKANEDQVRKVAWCESCSNCSPAVHSGDSVGIVWDRTIRSGKLIQGCAGQVADRMGIIRANGARSAIIVATRRFPMSTRRSVKERLLLS